MIGGDSSICYSMSQARKIDAWLAERDFFKSQYNLQKKALSKASELANSYEQLIKTYKVDRDYWKKLARKRNRETAAIASGIGAVASGVILYLVLKK